MDNFLLVLAYLAIGLLLRTVPGVPKSTGISLNAYVLYAALPALVLNNASQLQVSRELIAPILTPWLLLAVVAGIVLLLGRLLHWPREVIGALLIVLPLGNTSFLGYPMTEALFGAGALPYAVVYDQAGSFIALVTYATVIAALYSPTASRPTARATLVKIITFPSFVALLVGLQLRDTPYPALVQTLIDSLAATLVPVVMVAVGFALTIRFTRSELAPLGIALAIKLILMPALAALLWLGLGQQGMAVKVSIFQAAMPSMISAGAIAIMAGLAPRLVSGVVGLGIVLSLATVPMVFWLLEAI